MPASTQTLHITGVTAHDERPDGMPTDGLVFGLLVDGPGCRYFRVEINNGDVIWIVQVLDHTKDEQTIRAEVERTALLKAEGKLFGSGDQPPESDAA